jgi:hypothetical protein
LSLFERRLADGIARLPESEKLLATLLYYERLDQDEAASRLGLSSDEAAKLAASLHERLADAKGLGDPRARRGARADYLDQVPESNEANNTLVVQIIC